VQHGYPFIGLQQMDKFTPHMLNLDLLDAISFDKGCYTGQEIVARTHYKGATKRRTLRFSSEQAVNAGDKVSLDGRDIGEVLNTAGTDLLAVVPVAKSETGLSAGDTPIELVPLPYPLTEQS
jgi:folate-binding protein YgfZ